MTWIPRLRYRLHLIARRSDVEREMDAEMRDHVAREAAEYLQSGMTPDAARRAALVAFGGIERFKEEGRHTRGNRTAEDFTKDLRFAVRLFTRNPGFSFAAVATFALGIGSATAIFSVVNAVLLTPLPYRDPQQLVAVWERRTGSSAYNVVSVTDFEALNARQRIFTRMAALIPDPVTVLNGSTVERVNGVQVSPGYFGMLGVAPAMGREFTDAESAHGGASVVILSHEYWQRHFGGDSAAVGQSLIIDARPATVVGVMPAAFDPPRYGWIDEQECWLPFGASPQNRAWGHVLHVVGRLRPGVSLDVANAELAGLGTQLAVENPEQKGWSIAANSLAREITGDVRLPLLLLLGGVLLLLLMSVTNVANLTLGLTRRREHELAVRRAVGATTSRLARQLFAQSALLGALGCAVGLGVAALGVRVLTILMPPGVPRVDAIRVDATVLLAAVIATAVATLVFGTVAAFRGAGDSDTPATLVGATRMRATSRLGGGSLITAEIALSLVLTILAGLMARSFANLRAVNLGFDARQVVAARVALTGDRYASADAQRRFFDRLVAQLRAAPGVTSASMVTVRPFRGVAPSTRVTDPAHPPQPGGESPIADIRFTDSTLFGTLRIPVLAGGTFAAHEEPDGPPRVVVSEALVRALDLPSNPVGRTVDIALNGGIHAQIVGVVGDVHLVNPRTPPRPTAYLASARYPDVVNDVVVRGTVDAGVLMQTLRRASAAIDPMAAVYNVEPLQDLVDRSLARDRFTTFLLGAFSLTSLLLAGVGIYGVFTADVSRRRGEIGIRRALGAGTWRILGIVLRRALQRAAVGVAVGIGAALVLTRWIATLLYGIGATDVAAFVGVTAILLAAATVAALVPAWRAARVSPLTAIRSE
jgi:putative ABC transport system permease protein